MATLGVVSPKEWLSRTSLGFGHSRSELLKRADAKYAEYFAVRSEASKKALHQALTDYLISKTKSRMWEDVRRDKKSGGLMKHMHTATRAQVLKKNVLVKRIPEARHGALYLWQKADVQAQWAKIALEGSLSVGLSTAKMLQAGSYNNGEKLQHLGVIAKGSDGDNAVKYLGHIKSAAGPLGLVPKPQGAGVKVDPKAPPPAPEQRAATVKLAELGNDPGVIARAKKFFGAGFQAIYNAIRDAVNAIFKKLKKKYQSVRNVGVIDTFGAGSIGGGIVSLINFILGKVLKSAAPLIGNAIEIGQGIAKTILAAKDRAIAYMQRSNFVIAPGHPTLIGNSIEKEINWSIANGLYSAAKGGAKLGANIASWGASTLIDVVAACVEFAWKMISRWFESHSMKSWIAEVKSATGNRNTWKADPDNGIWRPAIVYDDNAFNELFKRGCSASPCVPMMTLNSGIAGDQMMFMRMFDHTGGILGQGSGISSLGDIPSASAQSQFDAATKYWTHLKQWGRNYLKGTGFTFNSSDPVARGLLWHAIAHHTSASSSKLDTALHMVAGS